MNKKERKIDLIWCWITALAIIFILYFVISIIEVWHNNSIYWETGISHNISELNLFYLISRR